MSYFVVNHVSDEGKRDGLVESYQMVTLELDTGALVSKRLNFVHWPSLPVPFVHEEWSENLVFANVYVPEEDNVDDEEEEDNLYALVGELLETDYPDIFQKLEADVMTEEEEEFEESDETE